MTILKLDYKMRLLVVDDHPLMVKMLKNILKQLGFNNVISAENGVKALEIIRSEKIDLVITDWNMPEMSGLELLHAIREDDSSKEIPVIMVTAEGLEENVVEAVKTGVDNFIVKPFAPATIKVKIEQVMSRRFPH
jgi:two-component system chemotaxis response regulator CheY